MLKRTLTGIGLVILLAGFMLCGYFVSPIFVDILILIFLAGSAFEMRKCLKNAGYDMYVAPSLLMLLSAYPVFYLMQHFVGKGESNVSAGIQGLLFVFLAATMLCLTIYTFRPIIKKRVAKAENDGGDSDVSAPELPKADKNGLNNLLANVFLIVYPMLFLSAAWILSYKYSALFAVLFAIFVPVIGSDMFAYFVGSAIGGKKLCPSISPKKTVAGAVGGLIGGMIVSLIFWAIFEIAGNGGELVANSCLIDPATEFVRNTGYRSFIPHSDGGWMWKTALIYLAIGLICAFVSEIGDLAASSIKRAIGIKDYGKIFPGHGGFMDRIDSVMYCIVVLLIAFTCIYGY